MGKEHCFSTSIRLHPSYALVSDSIFKDHFHDSVAAKLANLLSHHEQVLRNSLLRHKWAIAMPILCYNRPQKCYNMSIVTQGGVTNVSITIGALM